MIKRLKIRNFKSIRSLNLNCTRINIFIGEPNTGKSNILETIGILSHIYHEKHLRNFIRFENMSNLYYDQNLKNPIIIGIDDRSLQVKYENGHFIGDYFDGTRHFQVFNYSFNGGRCRNPIGYFRIFKFYRFQRRIDFPERVVDHLNPPDGDNLLELLLTYKNLRETVAPIFTKFGFKLTLEPVERKIKILKIFEDFIVSIPYQLVSDTLQRLVFHLVAIESNRNSVIAFEEPESHAFPYYTKYLAERIALDKNGNQYFISTHNPYFLASILEKASLKDVSVFITYMEKYETKVKCLEKTDLEEILDLGLDVFFNIERFLSK